MNTAIRVIEVARMAKVTCRAPRALATRGDSPRSMRRLMLSSMTMASSTTRRSEEHTSELQSLMRISYAVFCLKKKIIEVKNTTQQLDARHNSNTDSHHR